MQLTSRFDRVLDGLTAKDALMVRPRPRWAHLNQGSYENDHEGGTHILVGTNLCRSRWSVKNLRVAGLGSGTLQILDSRRGCSDLFLGRTCSP